MSTHIVSEGNWRMYRTQAENRIILNETNELAVEFAKISGWKAHDKYEFHKSSNYKAFQAWKMAATAQLWLRDIDLDDVLAELEYEEGGEEC